MERSNHRHMVDLLFVLGLFAVFTISSLLLIVLGTHVYQKTIDDMNQNYSSRTASAYLTEKIRQNNESGNISLQYYDQTAVLDIKQNYNGVDYHTYLYENEHHLCECFIRDENGFSKDYGTPVLVLSNLSFCKVSENLLQIQFLDECNQRIVLYISI